MPKEGKYNRISDPTTQCRAEGELSEELEPEIGSATASDSGVGGDLETPAEQGDPANVPGFGSEEGEPAAGLVPPPQVAPPSLASRLWGEVQEAAQRVLRLECGPRHGRTTAGDAAGTAATQDPVGVLPPAERPRALTMNDASAVEEAMAKASVLPELEPRQDGGPVVRQTI